MITLMSYDAIISLPSWIWKVEEVSDFISYSIALTHFILIFQSDESSLVSPWHTVLVFLGKTSTTK